MIPYKLAFIIERYFEFGGLQRDMRRFALGCANQGHTVTVFTNRWDGPVESKLNVQIIDVKAASNHTTMRKLDGFVRKLKQQNEFDCIIGFNKVGGLDVYFGGDVCLKAKLQHQHRPWLRYLPRYRTYLALEQSVFGPACNTELMLISPIEANKIQRFYNTPTERIHLLPPGIDRHRLTANPLTSDQITQFRRDLGVGENEFLILTVGSSFHTKGIDRAIHAISALPHELKNHCRYVVVGLGKEKKFKAIAKNAGICDRVLFMGGRQDVENFYHAADVLIHPARTENTGNSLLEAMVTGLPVIVTENCGYAHYIQEASAGTVCPEPFDQMQLNEILCEILKDDHRRIEYGKNGGIYCQTADIYSMFERGVEIIVNQARKKDYS